MRSEANIETSNPSAAAFSAPASASPVSETSLPSDSSRFNRLPQMAQLGSIAALSMLLLSAFQWLLHDRTTEARYLDHYGNMVANQLTRLSKDAMVREDVIALNVLAEQVASAPAISSVTVYSLDGRTLASYGSTNRQGAAPGADHEFNRPIQLAEATAGFVRVTVDPEALHPPAESPMATPQMRVLTSWLLTALALWGIAGWLTRTKRTGQPEPSAGTATRTVILLAVRLFNSTEMSAARRDALMEAAAACVAKVTELYAGAFLRVEPGAIAVVFESPDAEDRAFQVACAALVIARLCNQPGGGRYRYSLQYAPLTTHSGPGATAEDQLSAAFTGPETDDILADALLHAALASDNTIVLSATYAKLLPRPERLELTREHSPALAALQTVAASEYYLLSGANAATEAMLARQTQSLRR